MVNAVDFAARLEKIMEYYGLTASALADEMDFNRSTISHLISGRNKPSLEFVMKILNRFSEVKLNWLVLGKGVFPSLPELEESKKPLPAKSEGTDPDLFSEEMTNPTDNIDTKVIGKQIDRIVVFYKDGTFKNYQN